MSSGKGQYSIKQTLRAHPEPGLTRLKSGTWRFTCHPVLAALSWRIGATQIGPATFDGALDAMNGPEPFGKYVLMERVAIGGMAEIFRARMLNQGTEDLCIKRILPHYSEDDAFVNMFIDEASIAAKLQHENIVQIYDFDTVEGCYYIAMELVTGRDLKQTLEMCAERGASIPVEVLMFTTQGLSRALQYAPTKEVNGEPLNIVHRDVSPHNVMLSFDGDVKLTDFGIAKAASRLTTTRAGTVKGKCAYMSPEQARGKMLDGRSDIFSIGILMYEMLTGRRLFTGDSDFDILTKVLKEPITPPGQFRPGLDPEIERICMKALERDRDLRYGSCAELDKDVTAWLDANVRGDVGLSRFLKSLFGLSNDPLPQATSGAQAAVPVPQEVAAMAEMKTAMFNREDLQLPDPAPQPASGAVEMAPRMVIPAPGSAGDDSIYEEKTQAMDVSRFSQAMAAMERNGGQPPAAQPPAPAPVDAAPSTLSLPQQPMPAPRPPAPARSPMPSPPQQQHQQPQNNRKMVLALAALGGMALLSMLLLLVAVALLLKSGKLDGMLGLDNKPAVTTNNTGDGDDKGQDNGAQNTDNGDGNDGAVVDNGEDKDPAGEDTNAGGAEDKGTAQDGNNGEDGQPDDGQPDDGQPDDGQPDDGGEDNVANKEDQDPPPEDDKGGEDNVADNKGTDDGAKDGGEDKASPPSANNDRKVLTPAELEARKKALEEARKRRGNGTLVINAVPWADVTVDGRRRGRTPMTVTVPAGNHSIILSNPDKKAKKLFRVKVNKDGSKKVFHIFK